VENEPREHDQPAPPAETERWEAAEADKPAGDDDDVLAIEDDDRTGEDADSAD
jgi:hypothetical protein